MTNQEIEVEIFENMKVQVDLNITVPKGHVSEYPIAIYKRIERPPELPFWWSLSVFYRRVLRGVSRGEWL
jgi:hypothetical protein